MYNCTLHAHPPVSGRPRFLSHPEPRAAAGDAGRGVLALRRRGARLARCRGRRLRGLAGPRQRRMWPRRSAARRGTLAYINGTQFTHEPVERLAAELARRAPGDLSHAYFLGSGSEAVEAALKLARQYWVESGRPDKTKVLSLAPGYHGNTILALSASGRPRYQTFFHSWLVSVPRVPAPYPYRCDCGGQSATARSVPARRSNARSSTKGPIRWRRSSPNRWGDRPPARRFHGRSTGATCARSATGTACSGSPTRSSRARVAPEPGSPSSRTARRRTC